MAVTLSTRECTDLMYLSFLQGSDSAQAEQQAADVTQQASSGNKLCRVGTCWWHSESGECAERAWGVADGVVR